MRQGKVVADNVIARIRRQPLRPYVHKDLGLVVDLGGLDAVSKPLGVELKGIPALAVARGYHWSALRTGVAKARVATNWALNAVAGDDFVRTGFQARKPATLKDFEYTDSYLTPEQLQERVERHKLRERAGRPSASGSPPPTPDCCGSPPDCAPSSRSRSPWW
jgi:NADH dehydrogenase